MTVLTASTAPRSASIVTRHFATALGGNFMVVVGETSSPTTRALYLRRIDATPDQWPGLWLGVMLDHAELELEDHANDLNGWWESEYPVTDVEAAKIQAVHVAFTTYDEWRSDHHEVHRYTDPKRSLRDVVFRLYLGRGQWIEYDEVKTILARDFSVTDDTLIPALDDGGEEREE